MMLYCGSMHACRGKQPTWACTPVQSPTATTNKQDHMQTRSVSTVHTCLAAALTGRSKATATAITCLPTLHVFSVRSTGAAVYMSSMLSGERLGAARRNATRRSAKTRRFHLQCIERKHASRQAGFVYLCMNAHALLKHNHPNHLLSIHHTPEQ